MDNEVNDWKYDLEPVFSPRSIAIIGPSDEPGSWQDRLYRNICRSGFKGDIFPVHPKKETVWGIPCYKSVDVIDGEIDLAIFIIPSRYILPALEQCVKKRIKAAVVMTSGFAEMKGPEGKEMQERIRSIAEQAHIRLIGPNCLGAVSFVGGIICHGGGMPDQLISGGFGVVGQSGALSHALMQAAQKRGLGMSYLVSSGNEAVLEASDYIRFMIEDPHTKVIGAFIEGFKDPAKFLRVSELALKKEKPIIIMKVGRSQKAGSAARAHTGSLVGSDRVQNAVFFQRGIIRANTIDEVVETASLFCHRRPLRTGGLMVMGTSGGACAAVADYCEELGLRLPDLSDSDREEITKILPPFGNVDNPLDATGQARQNPDISCKIIDVLIANEDIDIFLFAISSLGSLNDPNFQKILEYFAMKGKVTEKIVGVLTMISESIGPEALEYCRRNPIPVLMGGRRGLLAIRHLIAYNNRLERLKRSAVAAVEELKIGAEDRAILIGRKGEMLKESEAHRLLEAAQIRSPESGIAMSPDEALKVANRIGYPVVLKIDSTQIAHKTEIGALILDIGNDNALVEAYHQITNRAKKKDPHFEFDGVLVQKMAPQGLEMIVGVVMDNQFGPAVVLGMGGVFVEVLRDTSIRIAPVSHDEAVEMIRELTGYRLLEGYRGQPAGDIDALALTIVKVSALSLALREELKSLEINPLRVLKKGEGVLALDALLELN